MSGANNDIGLAVKLKTDGQLVIFINQLMVVMMVETLICLYGVACFHQPQWLAWLGMGCFVGFCAAAVAAGLLAPNQTKEGNEAT